MPLIPSTLLTTLLPLFLILLFHLIKTHLHNRKYRLPPGPPTLPFIGNMHLLPPSHQGPWASLTAQRYGELFTLRIASTTWVFLNSSRVVTDLLEKRSAIYSSRPRMPFASECMSGGCRVVVMPYGERWRSVRKIMHGILNGRNAELFRGFQERESERLVGEVLRRPEGWWAANQRYANGVVMGVVFGKGITSEEGAEGLGKEGNGKSIFGPNGEEGANVLKKNGGGKSNIEKLFDTSQEFIAALQPGANLVDVFTFLDRLPTPLKWWIPRGKASFQRLLDVYGAEVRDLNQRVKNGTCPPCFATKFLDDPASEALGETQRLFALGSLMEAGSDTSRMTLSQIIAAAATDARWVRRAQEVMDRVLGVAERLPGLGDRGELRYLSAVVKEGWRWRPFAEIGMPHMLIKDDVYEGYRFPAGTVFTVNTWHISLNPEEYPDPLRFWPERWLDPEIQGFDPSKLEDPLAGHWNFGTGRRVCTGYHVGDSNVWIIAARLLYCFNFEQFEGKEIDTLNMNVAEHRWAPFDVKITVRSQKHRELIERYGGEAVGAAY